MSGWRIPRINSLLREVLTEVIRNDVRDPDVSRLLSITRVDTSKDLHNAKVYISVVGTDKERQGSCIALNAASGYVAKIASKKVNLRTFPHLTFHVDEAIAQETRIANLLSEIDHERRERANGE